MTTACFKIDGEWLTEHARNLVREGRWDHAMRTLVEGLHGMTNDIAITILKGDAKLVGVNDVDLVDDDDTEYKAQLDWHFAGVFVDSQGRNWRPYGVVTGWCAKDMVDRDDSIPKPGSDFVRTKFMGNMGFQRDPLHYADDRFSDIARIANVNTGQVSTQRGGALGDEEAILCREIHNFPHMLYKRAPLNDVSGAIADLFERGVMLREYFPDPDEVLGDTTTKPTKEQADATLAAARKDEGRLERVMAALKGTKNRSNADYRKEILKQADGDLFDLAYMVNGKQHRIKVPTAPFQNWAMWRTAGAHLAKPWKKVTPPGMKMMGDDPYHTDWMLGAGLDLDAMTEDGSNLHEVAFELNFKMQNDFLNFNAAILCGDRRVKGRVVHAKPDQKVASDQIAVIPSANARYLAAAVSAAGVIVERGGSLAHLVVVAREQGVTIMRVEHALKLYPEGSEVLMNPEFGNVTLTERWVTDLGGNVIPPDER